MSKINKLSDLKGFIGAFEFSDEGKLVEKSGKVDDNVGNMLADLSSANMRMGNMQAKGFTEFSKLKGFESCNGFALSGASFSLCVVNSYGILVENMETNFNEVFQTLNTL